MRRTAPEPSRSEGFGIGDAAGGGGASGASWRGAAGGRGGVAEGREISAVGLEVPSINGNKFLKTCVQENGILFAC